MSIDVITCENCIKADVSQCGGCPRKYSPQRAQDTMAALFALPDSDPLRRLTIQLRGVMPKMQGVPGADGVNILDTYSIICSDSTDACVLRSGATVPSDTEMITVEAMTGITPA